MRWNLEFRVSLLLHARCDPACPCSCSAWRAQRRSTAPRSRSQAQITISPLSVLLPRHEAPLTRCSSQGHTASKWTRRHRPPSRKYVLSSPRSSGLTRLLDGVHALAMRTAALDDAVSAQHRRMHGRVHLCDRPRGPGHLDRAHCRRIGPREAAGREGRAGERHQGRRGLGDRARRRGVQRRSATGHRADEVRQVGRRGEFFRRHSSPADL